jgi:hypothetical protein
MTQNIEDIPQHHPYAEYENTQLWIVIDKSLSVLEYNQDIKLTTARKYVIGYICKQISDSLKTDSP